jgi:hypothetical protein
VAAGAGRAHAAPLEGTAPPSEPAAAGDTKQHSLAARPASEVADAGAAQEEHGGVKGTSQPAASLGLAREERGSRAVEPAADLAGAALQGQPA